MTQTAQQFAMSLGHRLQAINWRHVGLMSMMVISIAILLVAALAWQLPYGNRLVILGGEVAPFDVVAPQQLDYVSDVLTTRAQDRAAQLVPDQYDFNDGEIRRQQVVEARSALSAITDIRNMPDATLAEKAEEIQTIDLTNLSADTAVQVLSLEDDEWQAVTLEAPLLLNQIMRDEIRENSLPTVLRRVPSLVSSRLSEPASDVTIALVQSLIRPNSFVNEERTTQQREEARTQVAAQNATLEEGEIIIRSGDVATQEQAEALQQIAALQRDWDLMTVIRALAFALLILAIVIGGIFRLHPATLDDYAELSMLMLLSVAWLLAAKFTIVNHPTLPYFYPLAALSILIAVLCDLRVSLVFTVAFSLIVLFLSMGNAGMVTYLTAGALVGTYVVGRGERLNTFLWAGVAIAVSNLVAQVAFAGPIHSYSSTMLVETLIISVLTGVLSAAIALIGYFVLGNVFGVITPLQLTELSRPTHPLLRQLLLKASGTYHHTILVSNMAERAAAAIGADALLVRVGAYYHDIGKTVRPYFFAENIMDESSPHEKLDPNTSAQIIISHVKDGVDLAQKYRLPDRIQDFIREHHGRSLVKYFFIQAQRNAAPGEVVNEEDFRYPGPSPHSKETSILMLADTCEAAVRAVRPGSREELEALVNRLIDERVMSGELNESSLTFKELQEVRSVFLQVLQGVHHPRVIYPEPVQPTRAAETQQPAIRDEGPAIETRDRQNQWSQHDGGR